MLRNMKLSKRFFALLGLAAAFVGCRPEEADIDLPKIKVDGPALSFDAETKLASCPLDMELVNIPLTVTANRDWNAEITWDSDEIPWIAVTPDHGAASAQPQTVTLTVLNNAGFNRNKRVKFTIGYDYKTIDLFQTGERGEEIIGTLDNPLTVAGAVKYVKSLGADVQSSSGVYIKGKISRIDDGNNFAASGTYGNATFYISDDGGTSSEQFYCYRVVYLGNKKWSSKTDTDIQVGDDVIIYGYVVNYKGNTPETVQGTAFVYEHNGVNRGTDEGGGGGEEGTPSGTGTAADPYNVAAARAAVKGLTWTSNEVYEKTGVVYVKGKISRIADNGTFSQSGTFGNATFYISDDGAPSSELYAYRILYLGNKKYTSGTDIKVGDEVVICGELMNYRGNTPETVANSAYLYSLNSEGEGGGGGGESGDAAGTGTESDPYNVAAALNAVKDFTWTSNEVYDKTGTVYVKGKISRIASGGTFTEGGTYGNASFYISDDGKESNEFYCFRILYLENKKFEAGQTDIKVGDEVVICGELMNYRGNTPETVANKAYLYSLNSSGGGGGGDTPGGNGNGTLADPYTPAGAIDAVKDLTWTSNTVYDKTDKVYVKGKISRIANNGTYVGGGDFGNASYWISADGTENGEFQIFRSLYFNGEKYTGGTDIKVGDEVIVYGSLMNYKGNTPETVANESWLYSLNGKTDGSGSGGGGGDTPSGNGSGTLTDPYTPAGAIDAVKDLTWTSNTVYDKTDKVYVKGKISRIANNGTYVGGGDFGNASYWISADGTENGEFQIFRSLYFNGEKYTGGTDIKVGDEVIVYGALMNYKGNTPETVANESWLYSLNGKTNGSGGGGGGDTPGGGTVSFATNSDAQTWAVATDGTYGGGYATMVQGLDIGYYKHTSGTAPVAPNANHVRVYKNCVLSISSVDGNKIKRIVISCAPDAGSSTYCFDMTGLEGGANAIADKSAKTITWTGSAAKVVLHANNGQVRMENLTVEFE